MPSPRLVLLVRLVVLVLGGRGPRPAVSSGGLMFLPCVPGRLGFRPLRF
ncbi:hypothetical protein ACH4OX_36565 [Streptomyces roseolus]